MDHWDRVKQYRELAARTLEGADNTPDETLRATLVHMAAGWQQLAREAENIARSIDAFNCLLAGEPESDEDGTRH